MEITVTLNGRPRAIPDGCTVARLLEILEVDAAQVAVQRNLDVVPRATWTDARLDGGDELEIVTFVGGGS